MHNLASRSRPVVQNADAVPSGFARLAGTTVPHPFRLLHPTMGAAQCAECLGWPDDVRHPVVGGPVVGR